MMIEQMPAVISILEEARIKILTMTGARVKLEITEYPAATKTTEMLDFIGEMVAQEFQIPWRVIQSKKRNRRTGLVEAKHSFMFIAHKIMRYSCTTTGKHIGRDHSTILHACEKIEGFYKVGDPVTEKIDAIIKKLPL